MRERIYVGFHFEDWIDEDHLVQVVDMFVDQLVLAGLGFTRSACADGSARLPSVSAAETVHLWVSESDPVQPQAET